MSRFRKLSQTIWHCQYHIVWTPKYRYRIITGELGDDVTNCIRIFSEQLHCEINELNAQLDHVPACDDTTQGVCVRFCGYRKGADSNQDFK